MAISEQVKSILLTASSSSESMRGLYDMRKENQANLSLSAFCKQAGMTSKGYLSDVLHGKRTLNMKYLERVIAALMLKGAAGEFFKALVERDHCSDVKTKKSWDRLLAALSKSFDIVETSAPIPKETALLDFEIFCAFGLFSGRPTRKDLVHYFGKEHAIDIDHALHKLQSRGWIKQQEGYWSLIVQHVAFVDDEKNMSHEDFLKQAIASARDSVEQWYRKREEAHFESFIISVDDSVYRKELQAFKESLLAWQAKFESVEGNRLVRFNSQVYPIR